MNTEQEAAAGFSDAGRLRDAWAATAASPAAPETSAPRGTRVDGRKGGGASTAEGPGASVPLGWMLGSAVLILVFAVALVTSMSVRRSERAMADLLAEKGSSLIMAFESALRTGLRGETGVRLQVLLEEMTRSPDIEFVAVTMPDGTIVAHSERTRLGETLRMQGEAVDEDRMTGLAPGDDIRWTTIRMEGRRVFVVYRNFSLGRENWSKDLPSPTIFLGLDVSPFEITRTQNRSYAITLSVVAFLMGLVCLLTVSLAQRARESRRRQFRAEGEVHRLEEEVRRREKLAAIGTLAAGVAHEIRNPLSSIKGFATYFRQRFGEGSEEREAADIMVREVNRLNRVITDLLGLSRPSDVKPRSVCLENIVAHVLRLIRQTAGERHIALSCRTSRSVPNVFVDVERLGQALLNLCLNALDAMPDGGALTIAISRARESVCLLVRDTGSGMTPEIMEHIFDPYFTTKGNGTGLGLPLVHKIITAHGGRISVRSRPAVPATDGNGGAGGETVFRVWLPLAPEEEAGSARR